MPGFDRTGPMGQGPRTGGGFGYCGPNAGAGSLDGFRSVGNFGRGRRNWRGREGGFGYRRWPRFWGQGDYPGIYPPVSRKEERDDLTDSIADLKADIKAMEERLAALNADIAGKAEA